MAHPRGTTCKPREPVVVVMVVVVESLIVVVVNAFCMRRLQWLADAERDEQL